MKTFVFAWLPCLLVIALIPIVALRGQASSMAGYGEVISLIDGSYSAKPAKFVYSLNGEETITTVLSNLSSEEASFDMGDGSIVTIAANSSIKHSYKVNCDGQVHRIYIKKIQDTYVQSGLILKIEPE